MTKVYVVMVTNHQTGQRYLHKCQPSATRRDALTEVYQAANDIPWTRGAAKSCSFDIVGTTTQ